MFVLVLKESSGVYEILCTDCKFFSSLQSSAGSTGKTVVDHGTNQELQEANARLRERLARMVLHTKKTARCTAVHTHPCMHAK